MQLLSDPKINDALTEKKKSLIGCSEEKIKSLTLKLEQLNHEPQFSRAAGADWTQSYK